jgi:hypothetical protein
MKGAPELLTQFSPSRGHTTGNFIKASCPDSIPWLVAGGDLAVVNHTSKAFPSRFTLESIIGYSLE